MKCHKCNSDLLQSEQGFYTCVNDCTGLYCSCGHKAIPKPYYNQILKRFNFWFCLHCFKRW